jgi:hypothetical protein
VTAFARYPAFPLSGSGEVMLLGSALAALVTVTGVLLVNPASIAQFVWFFGAWCGFLVFVNRPELEKFAFAFLVNSAYISVYVLVQATTYPDSYGTTSYHSVSWTDDSYFFSLAADHVPPDLLTRENFFLYSHPFSLLISTFTPLPIEHPLDALFFQSGTAAMLATFTRGVMLQFGAERRVANCAYVFVLACPFLMMNGGVILIRDTLAAALLVYSIYNINQRRYLVAAAAILLQIALRPGTGLLLGPAYLVIYWQEIAQFVRRHPLLVAGGCISVVLVAVQFATMALESFSTVYAIPKIGFLGRELIADLTADPDANALFLQIQQMPFLVRLVLNAAYIFLYPFLTLRTVLDAPFFDLRNIAMSLVIPVYAFWLNAWFFAGAVSGVRAMQRQRAVVVAIAVTLLLVGIYSLQTRHKTIIYPLYYMIVALGFCSATPMARRCGYVLSGLLLLVQVASVLR